MSKLINKTRLEQFATALWTKIKGRYDDAFINAEITESTVEEKKLKFTKIKGGNKVEVNLKDYARLTDKNDFKQDVSADNVAVIDNSGIGTDSTHTSRNRGLGFRQLTTKAFQDGYVDHIKVYMNNNLQADTATTWKVWAITKGGTNKSEDRVKEVVLEKNLNVKAVQEGGQEKKIVKIPVNKSFEKETYFIVRCSHDVLVATRIKPEYTNDVVNLNNVQPPDTTDSLIDWNAGANSDNNTAIMYLYGRESIGSLSAKLDKVNSDSSTYVKHSECTDGTGSETKAGKVVKLGADGKLHNSLMPSIALNEYFSVAQFTHQALAALDHFENGDVVVVTSGGVVTKRYLCIDKENNTTNYVDGFVELNSKDGVVTSVNDLRGAINLDLAAEVEKIKLNITSGSQTVTKELPIITTDEIDAMITALPN